MSYYNNGIPQASDFLQISQKELLNNFSQILTSFSINHIPFNQNNAGKHSNLELSLTSDPLTEANETALYCKLGTGNFPHLFFMPAGNVAPNTMTPIQLSYQNLTNTGLTQQTFLAGPFVLLAGIVKGVVNDQVITIASLTSIPLSIIIGPFICPTSNNYAPGGTQIFAIPYNISNTSFQVQIKIPSQQTSVDIAYTIFGIPT